MPDEVIVESPVLEKNLSVDLSGRVLLLETKVLILEAKFKVLETESVKVVEEIKVIKELEVKPQPIIYGANRKLKSFKWGR